MVKYTLALLKTCINDGMSIEGVYDKTNIIAYGFKEHGINMVRLLSLLRK
jgi:hypothetical protein